MTNPSQWRPTATMDSLKKRARVLRLIRQFFESRNVLEVETPLLSQAGVTDVHLSAFTTQFQHPQKQHSRELYLQTSPEFAMKRLLCSGSGSIYQISKAFRNEEAGRYHNPEFTLLEWYRVEFDHWQLIAEIDALLQAVLDTPPMEILTYQNAFLTHCGVDPLSTDIQTLRQKACEFGFEQVADSESDPDVLLQLLCCEVVEPKIGQTAPVALVNFPASQAALARLDEDDPRVARRFEVYFKGIELANGYHELTDPQEQLQRFTDDNEKRASLGLPEIAVDQNLMAALNHGLPDCAGVALGIDRLLMLAGEKHHIQDVLSFNVDNA